MRMKKARNVFEQAAPPAISEKLKELRVDNLEIVSAFFNGSLGKYLRTEQGRKDIDLIANDSAAFNKYLQALKISGATRRMARFLETEEGIEAYVYVCKREEGLRAMIKVGQVHEGRMVAILMLANPLHGWPAMYKILKRISQEAVTVDDKPKELVTLPSYDMTPFLKSKNPAKEMLAPLKDKETCSVIFVSFSENDKNSALCCKVLENKEVRKILFDHLTADPEKGNNTFRNLFQSKERKERMSEIFMSKGGTKLLAELATDVNGRALMTGLAITNSGRSMGLKVLLSHPMTIIRVGWNYFKEPKTGAGKDLLNEQ